MGQEYVLFYSEASIACILIFLMLLFSERLYSTRTEKQLWFERTEIAYIAYFISDMFWAAQLGGALPKSRFLVGFFNLTNFILLSLIAYCWFMYMAASENLLLDKRWRRPRLLLLPAVISVIVMIAAYITNPLFWINENSELSDLYFPMMVAVPLLYVVASFIISMFNAARSESREEKRLFILIGFYPLSIVVFGLVQTFILNAPLFCFGCTIMMLFFYIQSMQMQISVDFLTKLNNRGQIMRYMDRIKYSENESCYVVMIDINRFKQINDSYGHMEGDRALTIVADSLRQTAEQIKAPTFLGRYGGDEFIMIVQTGPENEKIGEIISLFGNILEEKARKLALPYQLEASAGFDFLKDSNDSVEKCLKRADEKLYLDKAKIST